MEGRIGGGSPTRANTKEGKNPIRPLQGLGTSGDKSCWDRELSTGKEMGKSGQKVGGEAVRRVKDLVGIQKKDPRRPKGAGVGEDR